MLRARALASISALLRGESRVVSTCISGKPELSLFVGNGHTKRWNAGTTQFINSFSKKSIIPKLMTEKLDPVMRQKQNAARKPSPGTSCLAESSSYLKSNSLKQEGTSASRKISNASVRNVPNPFESSEEDFEKIAEPSGRVTSVAGTIETGIHLPIRPMHASDTVTIRISNISSKTADATIHRICKSVGTLEGLMRKNANEVEALFVIKNNSDPQSILKQFDCRTVDKCRWLACVSTEGLASLSTEDSDQLKQVEQISSSIADLKRQIFREHLTKKLLLEDLENLHASLVHLENHPNRYENSSQN